jgi:hypothetical protein
MQHSGPAVDSLSYSARDRQVRALGRDFTTLVLRNPLTPVERSGLAASRR